jgi:(2R)-3-sulfolactate dehydrogenase (NADP+)
MFFAACVAGDQDMPLVAAAEIERTVQSALMRHGAGVFAAAEVARAVARAEAAGNRICGLYYLESYCQQLVSGRVQGDVVPVVSARRPAAIHVDAQMGFAQPAFAYGLAPALDAARQFGVATLAVGHAHTCTSLGYFTEQIAQAGLIGIGMTNASPIVAAPGGKTRVIGTNPIAFSVPDGKGGLAMQFDQSTTTVALGKITMAKAAGMTIPEGWALDAEGQPTTDPDAALAGSLVSMGGYKGWGFGLMAELLAAGMTGGVLSRDVKPLKAPDGPPHDLGQYYILIDPSTSPDFVERLSRLSELVAKDEGARLPGQHRVLSDPVDVDPAAWAQAQDLAAGD